MQKCSPINTPFLKYVEGGDKIIPEDHGNRGPAVQWLTTRDSV